MINKDIILPKVPKKDIQAPSNNAKFIEKREEWEKLGFDEWTAIVSFISSQQRLDITLYVGSSRTTTYSTASVCYLRVRNQALILL